jgi:hypothetical protein
MYRKMLKTKIHYFYFSNHKQVMIEHFIIGLLGVNSILLLWFFSPLKITLSKFFFKADLMPDEFDDKVFIINPLLGKLISCWICLSFWLSLIIGVFLMVILNLPVYWPLITFFCYPCLCYIFYKFIK